MVKPWVSAPPPPATGDGWPAGGEGAMGVRPFRPPADSLEATPLGTRAREARLLPTSLPGLPEGAPGWDAFSSSRGHNLLTP